MKKSSLTRLALLTSLSLILFVVEMALPAPIPVPGVKLGLANVITVWAIYRCTPSETALILIARILLGGLITGNAMALAFSLAGGLCCLAGGLMMKKIIPARRMWLNSALCGVLHNAGQIAVAIAITGTKELIAYLPFLVVSGLVCGSVTGIIAQQIIDRLEKSFFKRDA